MSVDLVSTIVVTLITAIAMEGVAWAMHRYIMHGPLWCLHRSHHGPRTRLFELNDTFGLFFSSLSIILIYFGLRGYPALLGVGIGMVVYGAIYFLLHDVLVHRRVRLPIVPKSGYLRRVYQAHHIHHACHERDGAVSFGFAFVPTVEHLRARFAENQARRASLNDAP